MQAYHQQLLREGVTRLLRFAAGTKAFRQRLHAQQQVQAAHSLQRTVRRCATLWKQKALGPGRGPQPPTSAVLSRRVTFEDPPLSSVAAGTGDASLETKRPPAPRGLWGALGSPVSAAGEPQLLELNAARWARKQPRCPDFLLEPEASQTPLGGQGPEALWGRDPALVTPFLAKAKAWAALDPSSPLPSAPGLKPPPSVGPGPELLPLPPSHHVGPGRHPSRQPLGFGPRPHHPRTAPPTPTCSFLGTSWALHRLVLALTLWVCTWGQLVPRGFRLLLASGTPGFSLGPARRKVKTKLNFLLPLATPPWWLSLRASSSNCRTTRP